MTVQYPSRLTPSSFSLPAPPTYQPPCKSDFCPSYLLHFSSILYSLSILGGLEHGHCDLYSSAKHCVTDGLWCSLALQWLSIVSHKCTEGNTSLWGWHCPKRGKAERDISPFGRFYFFFWVLFCLKPYIHQCPLCAPYGWLLSRLYSSIIVWDKQSLWKCRRNDGSYACQLSLSDWTGVGY